MGYSKVIKISDHKVKLVHQLNSDGTPYAEDVTIELDESVDSSRLSWLTSQDGKQGIASFSFSPVSDQSPSLKYPEG